MLQIAELKSDHEDPPCFSRTDFRTLEEWSNTLTSGGGKVERDPDHDQGGILAFIYIKDEEPPRTFLVQDPEAAHPSIFDGLRGV